MATNPHLGIFDTSVKSKEIVQQIVAGVDDSLGPQPRLTLPAGTTLTVRGEPVAHVTLVLKGRVALVQESSAGTVVMHEGSTGRLIGLMSMTEGGNAQNTARTTTDITCVQITFDQLKKVIDERPTISLLATTLIVRSLDMRLRRAEELHLEHARLSADLAKERSELATALTNLEEARTELVAQERLVSLGSLAAGIAHELNNPLAAIDRLAEYLYTDVMTLLGSVPDKDWAHQATSTIENAIEATSLSTREERALRKEMTAAIGDPVLAQQLVLVGIQDVDLARTLVRRSGIGRDEVENAASIGTHLRNLRSASKKITGLVASLRSYARPDGDPIMGVNLHENIDDAVRLLSHKLRDITVTRDYGDVPTLECHSGQLAQVWTNVLSNACDALTDTANPEITIQTSSPHEGWVRVRIIDSGPGIPPDVLEHIFEPRFTTKSGQVRFGMGIGMGISLSIVGKHHGTMRVSSQTKEDTGTKVTIDLPATQPKETQ
ncbi:MAG: ATP-binding protein [Ancrocorticia sp.]|uniref:ATP-binding protein n=1 Tax=Ancrocorticia sp. TaxID=2593684 RepID=UPI003F905515